MMEKEDVKEKISIADCGLRIADCGMKRKIFKLATRNWFQ
jgi:hypothetical protein